MSGARVARRASQWMLAHAGAPAMGRWMRRGDLLVLTYHNVVADGASAVRGEASLHLSRARFAAQLDALRDTHEVISLSDAIRRHAPSAGRPRAVITFDDAYRGAVTIAVEELIARGMPATIFVAPAFVGGRAFWWDVLAGGSGGEMPVVVRDTALRALQGSHDRVLAWAHAAGLPRGEPTADQRCATYGELRAASRAPGITFGAHTWSHPVLPSLDEDTLRREVERPLAWLRDRFASAVPVLAVPYGLSAPHVESTARAAGYAVVFPGQRGWIRPGAQLPFASPRMNVPANMPTSTFRLRSSGVPL